MEANERKMFVMDCEGIIFQENLFIKQIALIGFEKDSTITSILRICIDTHGEKLSPECYKVYRYTELITGIKWGWYNIPDHQNYGIEFARAKMIELTKDAIVFVKGIELESQFFKTGFINNIKFEAAKVDLRDIGTSYRTYDEFALKLWGKTTMLKPNGLKESMLTGKKRRLMKKYGFLPIHDPYYECCYFRCLVCSHKLWN